MIEADLIRRVKDGDLDAVLALDKRGFFPSPNESSLDFAERLSELNKEYADIYSDLENQGQIQVEDIVFKKEDQIPKEMFDDARKENFERYGFDLDWVPGFFYSPGLLFGGCAWGMPPSYFTLFILRPCFRFKPKWYIYFHLAG